MLIKSPVKEATITVTNASGEKFLCISSNANNTPASGALNAAESPAAAPHVKRYFSSNFILLKTEANPLPIIAPN